MTEPNQQERILQQSKHRRIRSCKLRVSYACTSLFVNTTDHDMINLYLSFTYMRQAKMVHDGEEDKDKRFRQLSLDCVSEESNKRDLTSVDFGNLDGCFV